jgi:hypothetical protein
MRHCNQFLIVEAFHEVGYATKSLFAQTLQIFQKFCQLEQAKGEEK